MSFWPIITFEGGGMERQIQHHQTHHVRAAELVTTVLVVIIVTSGVIIALSFGLGHGLLALLIASALFVHFVNAVQIDNYFSGGYRYKPKDDNHA
jgi:hypothetical protein